MVAVGCACAWVHNGHATRKLLVGGPDSCLIPNPHPDSCSIQIIRRWIQQICSTGNRCVHIESFPINRLVPPEVIELGDISPRSINSQGNIQFLGLGQNGGTLPLLQCPHFRHGLLTHTGNTEIFSLKNVLNRPTCRNVFPKSGENRSSLIQNTRSLRYFWSWFLRLGFLCFFLRRIPSMLFHSCPAF